MKKTFEITNLTTIQDILDDIEYGTLALCANNKPYSLPLNFVTLNNNIYFHGAKKGKKIDLIKKNSQASFSIVDALSVLPSYFSTHTGSACPATQLFKSIIIEGEIELTNEYHEKVSALEALMKKLQKEGKYIPLKDEMYQKSIDNTAIFKLIPTTITGKFKFGQHFNQERYKRVLMHLKSRGTAKDLATIKLIEAFKEE